MHRLLIGVTYGPEHVSGGALQAAPQKPISGIARGEGMWATGPVHTLLHKWLGQPRITKLYTVVLLVAALFFNFAYIASRNRRPLPVRDTASTQRLEERRG